MPPIASASRMRSSVISAAWYRVRENETDLDEHTCRVLSEEHAARAAELVEEAVLMVRRANKHQLLPLWSRANSEYWRA